MALLVQESWVDTTRNVCLGDSEVYESWCETTGELFRAARAEHGRCTGKVYVGGGDKVQAIGWVFVKRQKYEGTPDTFLLETWVTVHKRHPVTTISHEYQEV
jgi:hypothetical protein